MPGVRFERDGGWGIITIANPPLNLFSMDLIAELGEATAEAQGSSIRALLLRAEGHNFTAGAQVDDVFQGLTAAEAEQRLEGFRELMERSELANGPGHAKFKGR